MKLGQPIGGEIPLNVFEYLEPKLTVAELWVQMWRKIKAVVTMTQLRLSLWVRLKHGAKSIEVLEAVGLLSSVLSLQCWSWERNMI